ncbi:MAG: hypothetical protein ABIJ96_17880 [Elusimicrobiota bacterium]
MRWFVLLLLLSACAPRTPQHDPLEDAKKALTMPIHRLESYAFDPMVPMSERIGNCAGFLVEYYAKMDGRDNYRAYTATPAEKKLLADRIAELPAGMRAALEKKLIGICFIENFLGNGLTDWVAGPNQDLYANMVFNPAGFNKTLSQTLTERDLSVFKDAAAVKIDAGGKFPGIVYTLLHEITHAYDYVAGITPYTEPQIRYALHGGKGIKVKWDVWDAYYRPKKGADYPLRGKLVFYGLGEGPQLRAAQAPKLYRQLEGSPFASLYGSQSWGEDVAELHVFYHITEVLRQPYAITVSDGKGGSFIVEPMKNRRVRKRAQWLFTQLK